MQIEIHLPSGRLLALTEQYFERSINGLNGKGKMVVYPTAECIPHSTMCGPFSRDQRIAAQCKMLGNATSRAGAAFWASEYTLENGIIKP